MPISIRHRLNLKALQERERRVATTTGFPTGFFTVDPSIPCRRWPAGSAEQETAARIERTVTDVFVFNPSADVRRDDRLTVNGRIYTVVVSNTPSEPAYIRVLAEEIQLGT